jgi:hypothetical protein
MSSLLKLNLGCGRKKLPGFLNIDKEAACEPDQVLDLELLPWPFAESSAEHVVLHHVLEHLGAAPDLYLGIMRELYRVCAPDATIEITVPHPRSDNFVSDPTHVRPITPQGLQLFSKALNRKWEAEGLSNTPLGLYLDIDFEILSTTLIPSAPVRDALEKKRLTRAQFDEAALTLYNVISEIRVVLKARKGTPPAA